MINPPPSLVWSGGMDSKLYEWDFSRGLPTNIYDMSKPSTNKIIL